MAGTVNRLRLIQPGGNTPPGFLLPASRRRLRRAKLDDDSRQAASEGNGLKRSSPAESCPCPPVKTASLDPFRRSVAPVHRLNQLQSRTPAECRARLRRFHRRRSVIGGVNPALRRRRSLFGCVAGEMPAECRLGDPEKTVAGCVACRLRPFLSMSAASCVAPVASLVIIAPFYASRRLNCVAPAASRRW